MLASSCSFPFLCDQLALGLGPLSQVSLDLTARTAGIQLSLPQDRSRYLPCFDARHAAEALPKTNTHTIIYINSNFLQLEREKRLVPSTSITLSKNDVSFTEACRRNSASSPVGLCPSLSSPKIVSRTDGLPPGFPSVLRFSSFPSQSRETKQRDLQSKSKSKSTQLFYCIVNCTSWQRLLNDDDSHQTRFNWSGKKKLAGR